MYSFRLFQEGILGPVVHASIRGAENAPATSGALYFADGSFLRVGKVKQSTLDRMMRRPKDHEEGDWDDWDEEE